MGSSTGPPVLLRATLESGFRLGISESDMSVEQQKHLRVFESPVCAIEYVTASIQHLTFDVLTALNVCGRTGLPVVTAWPPLMKPWHDEYFGHAFNGELIKLAPGDAVVARAGVVIPCSCVTNDQALLATWRRSPLNCEPPGQNLAQLVQQTLLWLNLDHMRLSFCQAAASVRDPLPDVGEYVVAIRTGVFSGRTLVNKEDYEQSMVDAGFTPWDPLRAGSFANRLLELRNTKLFVMETGSDMANMQFLPPGACVIQIVNPVDAAKWTFDRAIAEGMGLCWIPICATTPFINLSKPSIASNSLTGWMVFHAGTHNFTLKSGEIIQHTAGSSLKHLAKQHAENILEIDGVPFSEDYLETLRFGPPGHINAHGMTAEEYTGIYINPYQMDYKYDLH